MEILANLAIRQSFTSQLLVAPEKLDLYLPLFISPNAVYLEIHRNFSHNNFPL